MGATVEVLFRFYPVADDLAAAMCAYRCELVDGALETIEHVSFPCRYHLEREVIIVPAYFANCHIVFTFPLRFELTLTQTLLMPSGLSQTSIACPYAILVHAACGHHVSTRIRERYQCAIAITPLAARTARYLPTLTPQSRQKTETTPVIGSADRSDVPIQRSGITYTTQSRCHIRNRVGSESQNRFEFGIEFELEFEFEFDLRLEFVLPFEFEFVFMFMFISEFELRLPPPDDPPTVALIVRAICR